MRTLPSIYQAVHCQKPEIPLLNDHHFLLRYFIPKRQVLEDCDKPYGSKLLTGRCHRQTDVEILQPTGPCSSHDLHQRMHACTPKLSNMYGTEHHHAVKNNPGSQFPSEIKLTPYSWVFSGVICDVKENGP